MRRFGVVIVAAVLAGGGSWFFGVGILPAIVIGIGVGVVALVLRLVTVSTAGSDWPPPPPAVTDGSRRESSELSWAIRSRGSSVDVRIVERIRRIATDRLAARQLDLENPVHANAIRALIGPSTYDVLTKPAAHAVRISDVLAMLDILDAISLRQSDNSNQPKLDTLTFDTKVKKKS